jgi:hypothetical protein
MSEPACGRRAPLQRNQEPINDHPVFVARQCNKTPPRNCRDTFEEALTQFGMTRNDIVTTVNPRGVPTLHSQQALRDRRTSYATRPRRRGDRVSAPGKAGAILPVKVRSK